MALTLIDVMEIGGALLGNALSSMKKLADETKARYENANPLVAAAMLADRRQSIGSGMQLRRP